MCVCYCVQRPPESKRDFQCPIVTTLHNKVTPTKTNIRRRKTYYWSEVAMHAQPAHQVNMLLMRKALAFSQW